MATGHFPCISEMAIQNIKQDIQVASQNNSYRYFKWSTKLRNIIFFDLIL